LSVAVSVCNVESRYRGHASCIIWNVIRQIKRLSLRNLTSLLLEAIASAI